MRYPTSMTIMGQKIGVELVSTPIAGFSICPKCKTGSSPYRFPTYTGKSTACPACGCEETQPVDNSYIIGQFLIKDNIIRQWDSNHTPYIKEVCENSFIHETIEAIDSICDLRLPHPLITTLASSVYQALNSQKQGEYVIGPYLIKHSGSDDWDTCMHRIVADANSCHKMHLNPHQVAVLGNCLYQALGSGNVSFERDVGVEDDVAYAEAA